MTRIDKDTLFVSSRASSKFFRKITGTFTRTDGDTSNYSKTFPHELENDELFIIGWVKSTNTLHPTEQYFFSLPYVNAMGLPTVEATWDRDNIYVRYPWDWGSDGTGTTVTTLEYTLICMIA